MLSSKEEKLACLLGSSWFIEKKESAFGFWLWLLWSWQEKQNWNCWEEPPLKQEMSMPFQTNSTALFSVSKRFMWGPAMQWFHLAVFHNCSVFTPFNLPLNQRNLLLYLTWSHLCSPAGLAAPPYMQYLGGQKSPVFSFASGSHPTVLTAPPTARLPGAARATDHRISSLGRVFPLFI